MGNSFRGQVLWYNPKTGKGTLIAEKDSHETRFFVCDFQGGPPERGAWVTYDVGLDTSGRTKAVRITPSGQSDGLVKIKMKEDTGPQSCKRLYARFTNNRFW